MIIPLTQMQLLLLVILAVSGCISIIQIVNVFVKKSFFAGRFMAIADFIIVLLYALFCYVIGIAFVFSDYDVNVIYFFLVIAVGVMLISFIHYCFKKREEMHKRNVVLFIVYFLLLLYLTIFMRIGTVNTGTDSELFYKIKIGILEGDFFYLKHLILNVLLFIPFGYFIPSMNPKRFHKVSFSLLGGLVVSTLIEGVQMTAFLGDCDINDIIGNTFGSVAGYGLVRFTWRVQKNWKII